MSVPRLLVTFALAAAPLLGQTDSGGSGAGLDPANLDRSVKPCEDFYQFANGGWIKGHPVPADRGRFGSFEQLADRNRDVLHGILDALARKSDWKKGSREQKVADFYASGMDEAAIEKLGAAPLKPWLDRIEAMKGSRELAAVLGELSLVRAGGGFNFIVAQDARESTRTLGILSQGGLGLPDRDYYLKDDAKSKELRAKYLLHVARMLQLVGEHAHDARAHAETVLALETRLAKASMTRVENRDPQKTYHKLAFAEVEALTPAFDWKGYFKALGLTPPAELNVRQPGFFKEFGVLADQVTLPEWRIYLRWHAVRSGAPLLSKAFVDEAFDFNERVLNGIEQPQDRWKRIQAATDGALGEALGQLFVEKAFTPEAKARMLAMVENMRAALKERIEGLDWMSPETKVQAQRKLAAFGVKIGYPDRWRDYGKLEIRRGDHFGNATRARFFEAKRNLAKLGRPVDRGEWGMTPPTVNAYYSSTLNEIVFPAGILQPPFFDAAADDAVNYGGIGAVIGHEMSHGFDDSGSQYDADGNLKNWWTDADRKAYLARTALIVKQFDGFQALPDQAVNGKLTLGENIGDLGGLKIAYAAWQRSLKGKPAPSAGGFTGAQRFFLNYATVWRNSIRDEALRVRLNTDPHSPGRYRVNGPLANLPEFYEAFGCAEGDAMKRAAEVRPAIW
ncbi:MAG: M13 family metallopeptidase [Holophagaceae bacterium]|nr:M13 family metallopeptidase [Holophagaceae bacterium]